MSATESGRQLMNGAEQEHHPRNDVGVRDDRMRCVTSVELGVRDDATTDDVRDVGRETNDDEHADDGHQEPRDGPHDRDDQS
jgi:hypothetical protein